MSFVDQFIDWAAFSLQENDEAKVYLSGRCVSEEQWNRHKIGYVPDDYQVNANVDPNHKSNVCTDKEKRHLWCDSCRYNQWSATWDEETHFRLVGRKIRGCIVLPLTDYTGGYVGFQTRSISEKVYDTFTIQRRPYGYFFGLGPNIDYIWAKKEVTLVEGAFDQLTFERLVSRNVIALTTSSIGSNQLKFISRFVTNVNSCLDLDLGGRKGVAALRKKMETLPHIGLRDIKYPKLKLGDKETKDLNEYWRRVGDVVFANYFEKQIRAF